MPSGDEFNSGDEQIGLIAESNLHRITNPFEIDDIPLPTHHREKHDSNNRRHRRRFRTSYKERLYRDIVYFFLAAVLIGLGAKWSMELRDNDHPSDNNSYRYSNSFFRGNDNSEDYSQFSLHEKEESPGTPPPTPEPTVDNRFVKRISIVGERNSGTAWLRDHLNGCFPRLEIVTTLQRDSHWFQNDASSIKEDTLVLPIFLNVFDWVETMRLEPHHMPEHMNLDWYSFVTKPWTMPRPVRDINLEQKDGEICQLGFRYNEVISCIEGTVPSSYKAGRSLRTQYLPIYELNIDGSGKPYNNIIELRKEKISNHLSVKYWEYVKGLIPIQYEALVNKGLSPLLDEIEELIGIQSVCDRNVKADPIGGLETLDEGLIHWLNDNTDWTVEAMAGYEFNTRPYAPLVSPTKAPKGSDAIERIALLGERNTGSRWVTKKLRECYPMLKTTPSLHRWKHWFQQDSSQVHDNTLVVLVSINPYDWVDAMMRVPHNMPAHMMNDWYDFLTTPWTMERPKRDLILANETYNVCQHDFKYNEIISCIPGSATNSHRSLRSEFQPIYELNIDGSGDAYNDILEFISVKKANFLAVQEWDKVKAFITVQYEELVNNGSSSMIEDIERVTGLKASCDVAVRPPIIGGSSSLDSDMLDHISTHTDWDVEAKYGYTKGLRPYTILSNNEAPPSHAKSDVDTPTTQPTNSPSAKINEAPPSSGGKSIDSPTS